MTNQRAFIAGTIRYRHHDTPAGYYVTGFDGPHRGAYLTIDQLQRIVQYLDRAIIANDVIFLHQCMIQCEYDQTTAGATVTRFDPVDARDGFGSGGAKYREARI